MQIRRTGPEDQDAILRLLMPVIAAGETYAIDRDASRDALLALWFSPDRETFVAEIEGRIVGTFYIRANQGGGGRHVCNCGYVTDAAMSGRGIARRMAEHSFARARERGFRAMQFNFVVSTNERAVRLWQSLGFQTVGRLPLAFDHPTEGFVDALVMHRFL